MPVMPTVLGDLRSFEIARGLSEEDLEVLRRLLVRRSYAPGELIIRHGEEATNLFLVIRGLVGVWLGEPGKGIHATILRNIGASLATKLRRANHHVSVLSAQVR